MTTIEIMQLSQKIALAGFAKRFGLEEALIIASEQDIQIDPAGIVRLARMFCGESTAAQLEKEQLALAELANKVRDRIEKRSPNGELESWQKLPKAPILERVLLKPALSSNDGIYLKAVSFDTTGETSEKLQTYDLSAEYDGDVIFGRGTAYPQKEGKVVIQLWVEKPKSLKPNTTINMILHGDDGVEVSKQIVLSPDENVADRILGSGLLEISWKDFLSARIDLEIQPAT